MVPRESENRKLPYYKRHINTSIRRNDSNINTQIYIYFFTNCLLSRPRQPVDYQKGYKNDSTFLKPEFLRIPVRKFLLYLWSVLTHQRKFFVMKREMIMVPKDLHGYPSKYLI